MLRLSQQAYYSAWGYTSFKLRRGYNIDLVHDAFIRWFDTTGKNLFEEHKGTIARVLRYTYLKDMARSTFKYKGEKHVRHYCSKDDVDEHDIPAYEFVENSTPLEELILQDCYNTINHSLSPGQRRVYGYFKEGYDTKEVAAKLGISRNAVQQHFHTISQLAKKYVADHES